jgi:quercetin dioxygenase-like cupin family protein
MSVQPFVLRPDQHEPALNVVGTQVTVLASNAATQSYGITLQQGEEGTGPPPHHHDWDEAFYVLKGGFTFCATGTSTPAPSKGKSLLASPGCSKPILSIRAGSLF